MMRSMFLVLVCVGAACAQEKRPEPSAGAPEQAASGQREKPGALTPRERDARLQELMVQEGPRAEERDKRIEGELKEMGDRSTLKEGDWAKEWAGTYYSGDGLGMNAVIRIAPKCGVAYTWHGCLGLYDANYGEIVEAFPDGLRVKLVIPTDLSLYNYMSERLYFVKWGERRYLVPEAQMTTLVNNYNEGGYAREEMYRIPRMVKGEKWHERSPAPAGRPELPAKYARLLLAEPLTIKVTAAKPHPVRAVTGPVKVMECELDLDAGKDKGLFVGMEIPYGTGIASGKVDVLSVTEHASKGRLMIFFGDEGDPAAIKVGEVLRVGPERAKQARDPKNMP
jgi:hypothetical protein